MRFTSITIFKNKHHLKAILLGLVLSFQLSVSFGQTDSTDLNFIASAPTWSNPSDEFIYPIEVYKDYKLQFNINVLAAVEVVWLEISVVGSSTILFQKSYTSTELMLAPYKNLNVITIDFGNMEIADYEIYLRLERSNKKMDNNISKIVTQ